MAEAQFQPFRFLDLPPELRMIVYKRLPREIRHYTVGDPEFPTRYTTLVIKSVSVTIISTCKQVYEEANPVIQRTITNFILNAPPRIIDGISGSYACRILRVVTRLLGEMITCQVATTIHRPSVYRIKDDIALYKHLKGEPSFRVLKKFVAQAYRQLRDGFENTQQILGRPAVEVVKIVSRMNNPNRHWSIGGELNTLNEDLEHYRIAVGLAGYFVDHTYPEDSDDDAEGVADIESNDKNDEDQKHISVGVPWAVGEGCDSCGFKLPTLGQMGLDTWADGWAESTS